MCALYIEAASLTGEDCVVFEDKEAPRRNVRDHTTIEEMVELTIHDDCVCLVVVDAQTGQLCLTTTSKHTVANE